MPDYLNPSNVLNPFMLWTDMSLRALDLTLSSSQNLSEGVDRFTRAEASPGVAERATFSFAAPHRESDPAGMFLATRVQRSMLDFMAQGWIQWMGTLGSLLSLGAGRRLASVTRRSLPAELTSGDIMSSDGAAVHTRAQPQTLSHEHRARHTEGHAEREPIEHALASSESKRRRKTTGTRSRAKSRSRRA